jgi:hypothetical protein
MTEVIFDIGHPISFKRPPNYPLISVRRDLIISYFTGDITKKSFYHSKFT